MKNKANDTLNTLNHWFSFRPVLIIEGVIIGMFSGMVVVLYRFLLEKAASLSHLYINIYSSNLWMILLWFIILIGVSIIVGKMIKSQPMISGSGIPQTEGILLGKLHASWWKVILGKLICGVLCIGAGLSLGREGPSIQLGASVGQGFSSIFKRMKVEEKYLITSGASAGLAAAFNAPLAGVMFALEEMHKSFSPLVLLSAMSAAVTSDYFSKIFFGLNPVFSFSHLEPLPLKSYGFLIFLGVMLGFLGKLFNSALLKTQDLYKLQKWLPIELRPMIPFISAGILSLILPQVLGGGHELVALVSKEHLGLIFLLIILIIKFIFTMLSYGSGSPGGIFLPLLSIGALLGCIYGTVIADVFSINPQYINNFIILSMAGYFTAIVRAPITGSILITEMTGSFNHLLSLTLVSVIAYITAEALKSKPVYESLLEGLLKTSNNENHKSKVKVILEIPIFTGSLLDGSKIKDIKWPENCLLVGIRRGGIEIIPKGQTSIIGGDCLIVLSNENDESELKTYLEKMGEKCTIS